MALEFTAPVPVKSRVTDASWGGSFDANVLRAGRLFVRVKYQIAGLLQFLQQHVVVECVSRDDVQEALIPMILTAPVDVENLVVHIPKSLDNCSAKVIRKNDSHFLALSVEPAKIDNIYSAGVLSCYDPVTTTETTIYCVVRKTDGVSVHPGILRALDLPENELGNHPEHRMKVNAILQVEASRANEAPNDRRDVSLNDPVIDAMINGKPPHVDGSITKRCGRQLWYSNRWISAQRPMLAMRLGLKFYSSSQYRVSKDNA